VTQTSMHLAGCEPPFPTSERPQTHTLDCADTVTSDYQYFEDSHVPLLTPSNYKIICIYRQTQLYMRWYAVYYM
jgi:hypothetical protein